jgi:hypothetical protein
VKPEALARDVAAAIERGIVATRIEMWDGNSAARVAASLHRRLQ